MGVLLDRAIISPIHSKMNSLDKEIQNKVGAIKRNLRILAFKDRIMSESARYSKYLHSIEFGEREMSSLLKEIEILANKSSVSLIDVKPQGMRQIGGQKMYVVTIICEAQMEQVIDFMFRVESSTSLLLIGKYQILQKTRDSSIASVTLTINKILM